MDPELQDALFQDFPGLRNHPFTVTSPATEDYNCFTYAVGRTEVWAWPEESSHWLTGVPREDTVASIVAGLRQFGYEPCETGDFEAGIEKVCVYAINGNPQHVARQLPSGEWTSKLGRGVDITHPLAALESNSFGKPVAFLKRPSGSMPPPLPEWLPPTTS